MHHDALLVPFGILEVSRGTTEIHQLNLLFGRSRETADFIVDGLELWWTSPQHSACRRDKRHD